MKTIFPIRAGRWTAIFHDRWAFLFLAVLSAAAALQAGQAQIPNPLIDYDGFLRDATAVGGLREERRVTEDVFLQMMKDPATIVYDARSDAKYQMLHVRGARHLSLPDVTAPELAKIFPSRATRIIIYCNNNFEHARMAFPTKAAPASLNIYTFNTLYSYGYTNVYELGPLLDIKTAKLPFEGTNVGAPD